MKQRLMTILAVAAVAAGSGWTAASLQQPDPADAARAAAAVQKVRDDRVLSELRKIDAKLSGGLTNSRDAGDSLAAIQGKLDDAGVLNYGGAKLSELLYRICNATTGSGC